MKIAKLLDSLEDIERIEYAFTGTGELLPFNFDKIISNHIDIRSKISKYLKKVQIKNNNTELLGIKERLINIRNEFSGFNSGIRVNMVNTDIEIIIEPETVKQIIAIKLLFVNELLNEVEIIEQTNIVSESRPIESLVIDKANHKILILYELGVLDHLKNKYSTLAIDSNTNLSKLLVPLLNEKFETIRKALENLHQGKRKSVINKNSVRKVKSELNKLGIDTKTLPDL
jgi:hypothetical protein